MRKLYTVYNRRTDELVAFELPRKKCAAVMGMTLSAFNNACYLSKRGMSGKWDIFITEDKAVAE